MDEDYLAFWESNSHTSIKQVTNIEAGSSLESTSDIMQLSPVAAETEHIFAPQDSRTSTAALDHDEECSSSSFIHGFKECRLSNPSESDLPKDVTGRLFPTTAQEEGNNCSSYSNEVIDPPSVKSANSRKRSWNSAKWKTSTAKRMKNSGDSGVSLKNKELQRKVIGSGCENSCRFRCQSRLNEEQRQTIFNDFWGLGDHTRQWDYIARLIICENREDGGQDDSSRKKRAKIEYTLPVDQDVTKVCKSMFTGTLGITEQWIRTVNKQKSTSSSNSITPDLRGRHSSRPNRIPHAITQSVAAHIDLFPRIDSHYCRKSTTAQYLEPGLNLATMYRLYKDWMQLKNETSIASEHHYRDIFNYSYNLRFHTPKKDQCDICTQYEFSTDAEKTNLVEEYRRHQENKEIVRKLKEEDKKEALKNTSVCVACFDLQKVLSTPKAETSILYYRRKLAVYNFTVFNIGAKEGFCYVWNETIAKRGSNEIFSCLWKFIKHMSEKGAAEIVFYSDNCGGQNRNRMVFATYALAEKVFHVKITHRFLEKGHTQSEGDAMHAAIEVASRHKAIYTQEQWCNIIRSAKKKSPLYTVHEMSNEEIFNFSEIADQQNWKKDETGNVVQISKVKEISTLPNSDFVQIKYNYREDVHNLNLSKSTDTWRYCNLTRAYIQNLELDKSKKADLAYLCEKKVIPESAQSFYRSIL